MNFFQLRDGGWMEYETGAILSTGSVAKMLKVSPRTAAEWCDSGIMYSYRIPRSPNSSMKDEGDRRIPLESVFTFASKYGIPLDGIFHPKLELISFGTDPIEGVRPIHDMLELGLYLGNPKQNARAIIIGNHEPMSMMVKIAEIAISKYKAMNIIAVFDEHGQKEYNDCKWADGKFLAPFNFDRIKEFARNFIRPDVIKTESEKRRLTKNEREHKRKRFKEESGYMEL